MKRFALLLIAVLALGLATLDADAARRFGGGGNIGRQRAIPMQPATPRSTPAPSPSQPSYTQPRPAPMTPTPQPGFMSRWGGLLAGLGLGALVGSLFGGHFGAGGGGLILLLLVLAIGFMLFRALAGRRQAPEERPHFAGIGSALEREPPAPAYGNVLAPQPPQVVPTLPPGFNAEGFLRSAKAAFIRLQAANDARDLDDIRDYTTPEVFAEISMQIHERGNVAQRTEVESLDAQLLDVALEGDYEVASVRYTGVLRDETSGEREPFDEIWNVRKDRRDARAPWLISGIQQAGPAPT